jgi:hypothetical protein
MRIGALFIIIAASCGDDPYQPCDAPTDCDVPDGKAAACLKGVCSWGCSADGDCSGGDTTLLCASFENTDAKYCFPPCDGDACPDGLSCRSTGGGNQNRKVCFPE